MMHDRNGHHRNALTLADALPLTKIGRDDRHVIMPRAQVEAVLALVYEQRTANLIAAFSEDALRTAGELRISRGVLSDEIKVRLNIGYDASGCE